MKTADQLILPRKRDHELMAEILPLQYSKDYSKVTTQSNLEFIFDPNRFDMKDSTLLTDNYSLKMEMLHEYGVLATKLRQ